MRSAVSSPEERLLILLAGTAARREEVAASIRGLATAVDYDRLLQLLFSHGVAGVIGTRLTAAAPSQSPVGFRDRVNEELETWRRLSVLLEATTTRLIESLSRAGIRCLPLKGAFMVSDIYGDPGMRSTSDIDLLIEPGSYRKALAVLAGEGYIPSAYHPWLGDLPLFEGSLVSERGLPRSTCTGACIGMRTSSQPATSIGQLPSRAAACGHQPIDELAGLLLHYSRDGLTGLRIPLDIGAWWDAHGDGLGPDALTDLISSHPHIYGASWSPPPRRRRGSRRLSGRPGALGQISPRGKQVRVAPRQPRRPQPGRVPRPARASSTCCLPPEHGRTSFDHSIPVATRKRDPGRLRLSRPFAHAACLLQNPLRDDRRGPPAPAGNPVDLESPNRSRQHAARDRRSSPSRVEATVGSPA